MNTNRGAFTLIELVIVIAVIIVLAAMAVPAFGSTLARSRIQGCGTQVMQDLQLVRDSAIINQQDLYVYFCTNPAGSSSYFYELFQSDPLNEDHFDPTDAPSSGRFVARTLPYGIGFGTPVQGGNPYSFTPFSAGGKQYFVLVYHCGKGSYFRGQPTTDLTGTVFSSAIGIRIVDSGSSRTWYVSISPSGKPSSVAVSP